MCACVRNSACAGEREGAREGEPATLTHKARAGEGGGRSNLAGGGTPLESSLSSNRCDARSSESARCVGGALSFCARKDYVVTGALRPPWPTRVGRGYLIGANDLIRRCLDVSRLQELPFVRVVLLHARVGVGRAAANSTHNYFLNESGTLRVPLSLFVFSESDFLLIK